MRLGGGLRIGALALATSLAFALACGDSDERPSPGGSAGQTSPAKPAPSAEPAETSKPTAEPELSPEALAKRGRSLFMSNCIACHNLDPSKPGAVGPAVAGSSWELVEAKVMRNEYPKGYTPKRDSRAMMPLPFLEKELPAIHAFLSAAGQ